MKVAMLSTTDIVGGAGIATHRIFEGLRHESVDAQMFVSLKASSSDQVHLVDGFGTWDKKQGYLSTGLRVLQDRMPLYGYKGYRKNKPVWSTNLHGARLVHHVKDFYPDIIQLHWVASFVSLSDLVDLQSLIHVPLVWRLSDMWPFTGGCHYTGSCTKYQTHCGACPQLASRHQNDITYKVFEKKKEVFSQIPLVIVAISSVLAKQAKQSSLFSHADIRIIHNGLDTAFFSRADTLLSKKKLGIPVGKKIIAFGAVNSVADPRKGFSHLLAALEKLPDKESIHLLVFGAKSAPALPAGFSSTVLGQVSPSEVVSCYSCADVMVVPSLEEAFGQTSLEALSCSTPVVCFANTGVADQVEHFSCGYVAKHGDSVDLSTGISWCLANPRASKMARERVLTHFTLEIQAKKYKALYEELLRGKKDI